VKSKTKRRKKKRIIRAPRPRAHNVLVTVPKEMRERMTDFQAAHSVVWSQIAQQAFEQYMDDHENDKPST